MNGMNEKKRLASCPDGEALKMKTVKRAKQFSGAFVRFSLILGICFVILFPIFFMFSAMTKTAADIYDDTVVWVPKNFSFQDVINNVQDALRMLNYWQSLLGTVVYVAVTTSLQVIASCVIGYGLARFKFKGNGLVFALVVVTIVVPPFTTLVPTYLGFQQFDPFGLLRLLRITPPNLLETYWPFILTCITGFGFRGGLFIFIMKQFFEGMPRELEEAAGIDGSGVFGTFVRIMMPSALGSIVTVTLFSVVWQWTDTINTTVYLSGQDTVMKSLQGFIPKFTNAIAASKEFNITRTGADMTILVQTAVLLTIIPLMIMYVVLQRYFVESIDKTGIVE